MKVKPTGITPDINSPVYENAIIVLVSTKHPGNLGSVARVMDNLGFRHLRLVSPQCEVICKDSATMAKSAIVLLEKAPVFDGLKDAVADCGLVVGTTSRMGVKRKNVINPVKFSELGENAFQKAKVAVVFGREDMGLSNEDIAHCSWLVTVPTPSEFKSFNLSHIVAIMCYELARIQFGPPESRELANAGDLENMFTHIEKVLLEVGFLKEKDPARMMLVIRQMLHRAEFDAREVKVIRGMLKQIEWKLEAHERE